MSKKRILIIISLIAVLIIGILLSIFLINNKNSIEFKEQEEKYDRYIEISEKINNIIDDSVKPIDDATNKDIGTDKTKINELNSKKEELLKYKVKINTNKITNLDKLKEEIQNLENSLKSIDEKLINLKTEEINDYSLKEDHQISILSNEITKIIEEINTLAKKQEEKKKELEEKQSYVGTYKNNSGNTLTITMSDDGKLTIKTWYNTSYELSIKNDLYSAYKDGEGWTVYPVGKNISALSSDTSKNRIFYTDLGISENNIYYKQ